MKFLNKIVRTFAVFVLLTLVVALFLPDHYTLRASTETSQSQEKALKEISKLKAWKSWSPMLKADSTLKMTMTSDSSDTLSWTGDLVGKGQVSIASKTNQSITMKVEFFEPSNISINDSWTVSPGDSLATKILWESEGPLSYPMERIFGMFLQKHVQANFAHGLMTFKNYLESHKIKDISASDTSLEETNDTLILE